MRADDVLDALDGAVEVIDERWRCVYRNAVCARMHAAIGQDPGYGIGRTYFEVYPRLAGTNVETAIRQTMEKRENGIAEFAYPDAHHFMLMRAFPIRDGGAALFFRDITATKRTDEREAFLLHLSDRMRTLSDPRAIMRAAAEMLGRHLQLSFVQYGVIIDDDDVEIVAVYNDGKLPGVVEGMRYRFSERAPAWCAAHRAGEAVYTEDRLSDRRPLNEGATSSVPMRGGASIPLFKDGRLVAMLGVGLAEPHVWTISEKEILNEVAERTWAAAEHARTAAALRKSENKYRTLFEEMGEGFALGELIRDESGQAVDYRYLEFNSAFEQQTGKKATDALGRTRRQVLPGASDVAVRRYAQVVDTQRPARLEIYEPGLQQWFSLHAFPRGGDFFATIYNNITARKLAESRQRYLLDLSDKLRPLRDAEAIMNTATRTLVEHLDAGRSYYVEYFEAEGYATIRGEFIKGEAEDLSLKGNQRLAGFEIIYNTIRSGQPIVIDDWKLADAAPEARAYMDRHAIRAQVTTPLIKEGKLVAALTLTNPRPRKWTPGEVTLLQETSERTWAALERAKAESALRGMLAQAESANQAKDEFLATLSHELRTPLAAILLWAHALRSGKVPAAELNRAIDAIVHSAESQSQLIEDLLDLSRLTAGKLTLAVRAIDAGACAHEALDVIRPAADAKHLKLELHIASDLGKAMLDGSRLKQIYWNLLSNAVKFTPDGGTITLRVGRNDDAIYIEVSDTGEGIEAELLPRVFDKFWQAEMGEARQHMGLGIGLALTKQLVELHGGTIAASSDGRNRGARFHVTLPFVKPTDRASEVAAPPSSEALAGLRVLLVEDDSNTRSAMGWMLRDAGADVVEVGSPHQALGALDGDAPPAVIICDLGLPEMSGYELIAKINEDYRRRGHAAPPSCAVSAHARDVDRERAIAAGFDMYLAKPIVPKRLIEAVTDLRDVLRRVD